MEVVISRKLVRPKPEAEKEGTDQVAWAYLWPQPQRKDKKSPERLIALHRSCSAKHTAQDRGQIYKERGSHCATVQNPFACVSRQTRRRGGVGRWEGQRERDTGRHLSSGTKQDEAGVFGSVIVVSHPKLFFGHLTWRRNEMNRKSKNRFFFFSFATEWGFCEHCHAPSWGYSLNKDAIALKSDK